MVGCSNVHVITMWHCAGGWRRICACYKGERSQAAADLGAWSNLDRIYPSGGVVSTQNCRWSSARRIS